VALVFPAFCSRLTFLSVRYLHFALLAVLPFLTAYTVADATTFVSVVISVGTALTIAMRPSGALFTRMHASGVSRIWRMRSGK
jgi:hypothetical protein